jgi:DNA-binding NarL/FixJ family response regulator
MLQITPQEQAALRLLARGNAVDEIASHLGLGERDVDTQLTMLFARMGAANPGEAIAAAFRRGLLSLDDQRDDGGHRLSLS